MLRRKSLLLTPCVQSLNLFAEYVSKPADKFDKLCSFLRKNAGPTLIYVTLQKASEHRRCAEELLQSTNASL